MALLYIRVGVILYLVLARVFVVCMGVRVSRYVCVCVGVCVCLCVCVYLRKRDKLGKLTTLN